MERLADVKDISDATLAVSSALQPGLKSAFHILQAAMSEQLFVTAYVYH